MRRVNVSSSTIDVEFDYDASLVELVKRLPDRQYDKASKTWHIPMSPFHASQIMEQLTPYGFQIDPRLHHIIDTPKKRKFLVKRDGLYDFQSESIDFLDRAKGRALIADEQGLGKTIEALYWLSIRADVERILVVCPASVVYKWVAEIRKWDVHRTVDVVAKGTSPIPDTNYVVMSYAIMTRQVGVLADMQWDCLILDECHMAKNPNAMRSRAAKNIESKYFLALSGTPIINRPIEFYNVLNMIDPKVWSSWWTYAHRYCGARQTYWGLDTSGASNLDELSSRVAPYMIRRLKKEVLSELPDLTRTKIPVKVNGAEIVTAYRALYQSLKANGGGGSGRAEAMVHLNVLRQAIGRAKIPVVVELAMGVLDADEDAKIVIYAVHKHVVAKLEHALKKYGVTTITGDIPNEERSIRCDRFQNMHMPRVMIISSAGGQGIDLYRSSVCIMAERAWSSAEEEQVEARCHRIGQKGAVEAIYVIAQDTIDEDIDELIESKRSILGQVIAQADVHLDITDELLRRVMRKGER